MPVGEWNDFRSYVYRTGLGIVKEKEAKLKAAERRKPTHLMLDGGRMAVPPDREAEFLEAYARELVKGTDLYVVEMKSEPCFFFMSEFDIKLADRALTPSEIARFVCAVQSVMTRAYSALVEEDERATEVAVSTAPPKDSTDSTGAKCVQSGVHLNWRIVVDLDTAWILRAWIVRELDALMKITGPEGDWPMRDSWIEAYDPCVLKDNGLRMIGSRKAEICPECKGKSCRRGSKASKTGPSALSEHVGDGESWENACATCQNVGKVDKGRPYTLMMVCDARGEPIPDALEYFSKPENTLALVKYTSIRCPSSADVPTPTSLVAAPYAVNFESVVQEKQIRDAAKADRKQKKAQAQAPAAEGKKAPDEKQREELVDLNPEDEPYQLINKFIVTQFRGSPIVSRVKRSPAGDCYIANTKCHFCENKGGDHGHSFVYFVVKPSGVAQRCFCDKVYGAGVKQKPCRDFVGRMHPLPSDLATLLFPSTLLAFQKREEKQMLIASRVLDTGRDYTADDPMPAGPHYGNPDPGIAMPQLTSRAAMGLRRRGISPKKDYNSVRAVACPPYSIGRFFQDVRDANFTLK